MVSEVTGIPDSSVRAAKNGRLKDKDAIKTITRASDYLEEQMDTIVEKAKRKFLPAA